MENIKDPILQIQNVSISYTGNILAVKNVSADVEKILSQPSWDLQAAVRVHCCVQ